MAMDFLKNILGDAYTEDIEARVSTEIGKIFVAKSDFDAKNTELKAAKDQLADAAKTIEGLQATDKDIEAVRKEAADYKARAEQAEKNAAQQLEDYKFDGWLNGLITEHKGRDASVIRALAGEDRIKNLRESKNRDEDGKALFAELQKNSAYAFEDQTPPPPDYAGGAGSAALVSASDAAMRSAMGLPTEKK